MTTFERALVCLLAVPLFAFGVAALLREQADAAEKAMVRLQSPQVDEAYLSTVTVASRCQGEIPEARLGDCRQDMVQQSMRVGAVAASALGATLIGLIALAGRKAQHRRDLLRWFKPGLYVTGVVVIVLIAAHGVLVMTAVVAGEYYLFGEITHRIVAMLGVAALSGIVGIVNVVRATLRGVPKTTHIVDGEMLSREQAPALWAVIDETAARLGSLHPDQVFVGAEPTFFVTEADVLRLSRAMEGPVKGLSLQMSLPFCRILTRGELTAILGHELAHFHGEDTKFGERFLPIYHGSTEALTSLQRATGDGLWRIALLPAIAVFAYFLEAFAVAERRFARERELEADATGASMTDARTMASALVKVHAFGPLWHQTVAALAEVGQADGRWPSISATFAEKVSTQATTADLQEAVNRTLSHPTDSHPTLSDRLAALGVTLDDVATAALFVPSLPDSAASLVDNLEDLDSEICGAYVALYALFNSGRAKTSSPPSPEPSSPSPSASAARDAASNQPEPLG